MSFRNDQVFVLEDDDDYRASLISLVRSAGMSAQGFRDAESLLAVVGADTVAVVLLDLRLPGMDGLEAFHRLARVKGAQLAVIVVTGWGSVPTAVEMMRDGAVDFLEKPVDGERLLADLRTAFEALRDRRARADRLAQDRSRLALLSKRERQVFDQLVLGLSSKDIGALLGISYRTVEVFRAKLTRKLQASSVADLHRIADARVDIDRAAWPTRRAADPLYETGSSWDEGEGEGASATVGGDAQAAAGVCR